MENTMPTRDELVAAYEAAAWKYQDAKVALESAKDAAQAALDAEEAASSAHQIAIAAVRAAERAMFERMVAARPQASAEPADG